MDGGQETKFILASVPLTENALLIDIKKCLSSIFSAPIGQPDQKTKTLVMRAVFSSCHSTSRRDKPYSRIPEMHVRYEQEQHVFVCVRYRGCLEQMKARIIRDLHQGASITISKGILYQLHYCATEGLCTENHSYSNCYHGSLKCFNDCTMTDSCSSACTFVRLCKEQQLTTKAAKKPGLVRTGVTRQRG